MLRRKFAGCFIVLFVAAALLGTTYGAAQAGTTAYKDGAVIGVGGASHGIFHQWPTAGDEYVHSGDNVTVTATANQKDAVHTEAPNKDQTKIVNIYLHGDGWTLLASGDSGDGVNIVGRATFTAADNLTVRTSGGVYIEGSHGLRTNHSSKITVGDNLDVETLGARSYGLYMAGTPVASLSEDEQWKKITIGEGSKVTTQGKGAYAAYIAGVKSRMTVGDGAVWTTNSDDATVLRAGSITASNMFVEIGNDSVLQSKGDKATAVYLQSSYNKGGENAFTFGDRTSLLTSGDESHGVHLDSYTYQTVNNKTGVTSSNDHTAGKVALGESSLIATAGNGAHGVYMAGAGDTADLGANSTVATEGDGSHALFGYDYEKITSTTSSTSTYHYGKNGKIIAGDGITLVTVGSGSHGAYTSGDTTSIEFKGDAAISVGSADSYALYADGGTIASNPSGGKFTVSGDMKTDAGGVIHLAMTDGSLFNGKTSVDSGDLSLVMVGTEWNMTGDSTLTNLAASGSRIVFGGESFDRTLTAENLCACGGTGSTFLMQSNVETGETDKLVVTNTTDGDHLVTVKNDGAQNTNGKETLTIVETQGGGSFALTDHAELGAWLYGLRQVGGSVGDWELYATGKSGPVGGSAVSTFMGGYLLSYAETQTLMQRLGDLRDTPLLSGFWFRAYGGKMESNSDSFVRDFDMNYGGVQVGYDRKIDNNWKGDTYVGGFFGYGKGDLDYSVTAGGRGGSGEVDAKTVGAYATYIQDDGFYADALLKYMWMKNKFDVLATDGDRVTGGDVSTGGLGLSLELGKRIRLHNAGSGSWYVEPQVQYSYTHQDGGSFYASNGLRVGVDSFTSSLGRIGLLFGYETAKTNFYAKVSHVKEFDGDVNVIANDQSIPESFGDSWWVYGLGFTSKLNERNNIYMSLERSEGGKFTEPWRVLAGWRISF